MDIKDTNYLKETKLLNFSDGHIQKLISARKWNNLDNSEKIKATYNFVKDEIQFGYNSRDELPASKVMQDGYGQCNTKGILLMALLRALNIPCRFHGFTINKKLQKGAMTGFVYLLAPRSIIHSWVEVLFEGRWVNLEGFILDNNYLHKLQDKFSSIKNNFCGYGVSTKDLCNPEVEWIGSDTYIQKEGINHDFGIFDSPDDFFIKYRQNIGAIKNLIFMYIGRHLMNRNVNKIRYSTTPSKL